MLSLSLLAVRLWLRPRSPVLSRRLRNCPMQAINADNGFRSKILEEQKQLEHQSSILLQLNWMKIQIFRFSDFDIFKKYFIRRELNIFENI